MNWRWQDFGSGLTLVTDGGGAKVVISASGWGHSGGGRPLLVTRDPESGLLRPLKVEDRVARLMMMAPAMESELRVAARQFRFYQDQHTAKGTPEADAKASANKILADGIDALLAAVGEAT